MMKKLVFLFTVMPVLSLVLVACGGTAEGVSDITPQTYVAEYIDADADHILLDVRTPQEFNRGAIEGAINIPLQELDRRLGELPTDQPIVIYCRSGNRSAQAATLMSNADIEFDALLDMGGTIQWTSAGYNLVTPQ